MKVREAQLLRAMQQSVEQQPEPETAERSVTDHDVDTCSLRIVLRTGIHRLHEAVGRIQKQKIYYIDGTDNSAGDLPAVDSSENTAPRDRICSLDRTWHRVHRAVRDNRVRRKPRQKEDAVHDHGRGRGNRAEALFIERIEAAFALGERLLVK